MYGESYHKCKTLGREGGHYAFVIIKEHQAKQLYFVNLQPHISDLSGKTI